MADRSISFGQWLVDIVNHPIYGYPTYLCNFFFTQWQANMTVENTQHLSMIFPFKSPFLGDFPASHVGWYWRVATFAPGGLTDPLGFGWPWGSYSCLVNSCYSKHPFLRKDTSLESTLDIRIKTPFVLGQSQHQTFLTNILHRFYPRKTKKRTQKKHMGNMDVFNKQFT